MVESYFNINPKLRRIIFTWDTKCFYATDRVDTRFVKLAN